MSSTNRLPVQVLVIPFVHVSSVLHFALFRRSDAGYWQFIAGGAEVGEKPIDAAKREANEEAGISISSPFIQLDTLCSVPANIFNDWKSWPANTYVVNEYSFGVELNSKELLLSDEHTDFQWVSYDEALRLLKWDSNRTALWELNQRLTEGKL